MTAVRRIACIALLAAFGACAHTVKVEPVDVNPITVTVDVHVKVDPDATQKRNDESTDSR